MTIEFDFPDFLKNFSWGQVLLAVFVIIFILVIIVQFKKIIKKFLRHSELHGLDKKAIRKKWGELEVLLNQKNDTSFKLAIIEADKLLDHVLKSMGFGGSSLGERLRVACYKFEKLRRVWWAHKIRNEVVHQADYRLDYRTAKKAVSFFEDALKELGIL